MKLETIIWRKKNLLYDLSHRGAPHIGLKAWIVRCLGLCPLRWKCQFKLFYFVAVQHCFRLVSYRCVILSVVIWLTKASPPPVPVHSAHPPTRTSARWHRGTVCCNDQFNIKRPPAIEWFIQIVTQWKMRFVNWTISYIAN